MTTRILSALLVLLFPALLFSQMPSPHPFEGWEAFYQKKYFDQGADPTEMSGTGYYPYLRERFQYDLRCFQDGTLPDLLDEHRKMKLAALNQKTAINIPQWQSLGPNTTDSLAGRMLCHAFYPGHPDTLYSGATGGGLWRTLDAGANWELVTDNLPALRISSIAFQPDNPDHMLIGTGAHMGVSITLGDGVGVLESTDGGMTWTQNSYSYPLGGGVSVDKIVWDQTDAARVYMASSNGFWISRDTGATWTRLISSCHNDIEINPKSPNIMYTTQRNGGVYRSTDRGDTWTLLAGGLPFPSTMFRTRIAICDSFPNHLIAGVIEGTSFSLQGVYRSRDGGDTWTPMNNVPAYPCQLPPNQASCQGWFNNVVEISPVDTNFIILAGVTFWRTDNGGSSWTQHDYLSNGTVGNNSGLVYVDNFDVAFHPRDPDVLYVFNDGGVQKSTDRGLWWTPINKDLVTTMVYSAASAPFDSVTLTSGMQDFGIQWVDRTGNNEMWHRATLNDGVKVVFDPNDNNQWFGCVLNGVNYRITRFGNTISNTLINIGITDVTSVPFHSALENDPVTSNVLYTSTDNKVYKTVNGGNIWYEIASIPNVRQIGVSPVNPDYVYLAAWNNVTWNWYWSDDGGQTFSTSANSPGWRVTDIAPDPTTLGTVFATRNSSLAGRAHVYKSTDHGQTWANASTGVPDVGTNSITINTFNPDYMYVGTDLGVFATEDGGNNWVEYNGNLSAYKVYDVHFHPYDTTLRIATIGRGIWQSKTDFVSSVEEPIAEPAPFLVYPNPAQGHISLDWTGSLTGSVQIELWNAVGQRVRALYTGSAPSGSTQFSVQDISPGAYYLRLVNGGKAWGQKLVISD